MTEKNNQADAKKTGSLLIMFLVFAALVTFVFLKQKKEPISWVDYQSGINMAKEQNKPALLAFIKQGHRFCNLIIEDTYQHPDIKKFVEQNFIPILIDVDKQPDLAEKYKVSYYPTHYAVNVETSKTAGPIQGYDTPSEFTKELKLFLEELNK